MSESLTVQTVSHRLHTIIAVADVGRGLEAPERVEMIETGVIVTDLGPPGKTETSALATTVIRSVIKTKIRNEIRQWK